jgi:lipoyl(octanoyl) transferase
MELLGSEKIEWKKQDGLIGYPDALAFMESRVDAIAKHGADDCVWLLEHPPLYTGGTSAKVDDLLDARFPVYETGRGGEYTYHGPGQRVAYLMLNLKKHQEAPDIKKYIWQLEEWVICTLAQFDVVGERRQGRVGIWVETGGFEAKIAAIGVRVRHWVAYHGIAINNTPDLTHFNGIVPCGIQGYGVTSLAALGKTVSMAELDAALEQAFYHVFLDPSPFI